MAITDIFSFGNHKLPKTTAIFNLPRLLTCPGATPACKLKCYTIKAERRFKTARRHRHDMYMLSRTSAFSWLLNTALERIPDTVDKVRIHESGDFYNQNYVNIWIQAAKHFPKLMFYAYTKSYKLDFSERPKNMIVRLSLDSTSPPEAVATLAQFDDVATLAQFDGVAYMLQEGEELPDFLLDIDKIVCPESCKICSYCGDGPGAVIFPEH